MSTSVPARTRRPVSALAAVALALAGLLVAAAPSAPAAAAGPELVVDDFSAAPLGARSTAGTASTVTVSGGGAHVSIGAANGTPFAEIRWTFASNVDLTDGNLTRQLQMDYSNAWGDPDAGNPIMMGLYVETATGTMYRAGTGLFAGSGKFVANFTQQGADDYRYLQGTGDLTRVRSIYVQLLSSSNSKAAGITIDRLAAVGSEDAYSSPTFTVPPIVVEPNQPVDQTVSVAGYPMPQISFLDPLPSWLTATVDGRTVTFTGTPTTTGAHTFRMKATTLAWLSSVQTVTVTVYSPPTLTGSPVLRAQVGEAFTHTLTVTGDPLPTTASFSPALPAGLSAVVTPAAAAGTATLTISGTPSGPAGAHPTRATVANGFASAGLDLDLEVAGPPSLPTLPDLLVGVGQALTPVDVTAGGFPLPTVSATGLPAGVEVVATATGARIVGTPTAAGTYPVTLTAGNGVGTAATTGFTLTVGTAPSVSAPTLTPVRVGDELDVELTVTGFPAADVVAAGLPAGVVLVADGEGWALRGRPTRAGLGDRVVTLTATNALGTATTTTTLRVNGPAQLNPAIPATYTVVRGTSVDVVVPAATGNPAVTVGATGLPPGILATDLGAGRLRLQGVLTQTGTHTVSLTATNSLGTDRRDIVVVVSAAPQFADEAVSLTWRTGDAVSVTPAVTSYPSHQVRLLGGTLPPGVTVATDGTLSGTPLVNPGDPVDYEAVIRAENSAGHDDLTVRVAVLTPPTADLPDVVSVDSDTSDEVVFTTGGRDLPTVTVTGLPDGLALSQVDAATWRIAGTAARADMGRHDITVTLENAFGRSSRVVHLDVRAPFRWDDGPAEVTVATGEAMAPVRFGGTGYPMPAWYSWSAAPPAWTSITHSGGSATSWFVDVTGTPTAAGTGTLALSDGLTSTVRTVTVRVVDRLVIDAPSTLDALADQALDQLVTVTGTPAAALTATGLPPGLALVTGDAPGEWHITGTPTTDGAGVHHVTLSADNGLVTTRDLTLTVGARPEVPGGSATVEAGTFIGVGLRVLGYPRPTVTVDGLPAGMTVSPGAPPGGPDLGPEWVWVRGTPTEGGVWPMTFRATNEHGTAQSVVTMTVQEGAAFADDALEVVLVEGVASTVPVPLVGYPDPTVTVVGDVPGMTLTPTPGGDPVLSGTPAPGSAGTYVLDVTAANTVLGHPRQDAVRITVRVDARAAVTAGTQALISAVGSPVDRVVTAAGSPAPVLTATGLPDGLTLVAGDAPGEWRITGTPVVGSGGSYTARLVAENGVLDPASVDVPVQVTEPVHLGVGGDGQVALRVGTPTRVGVLASGGWPMAVTLGLQGALPTGLSFVDHGDGTGDVVGTPAPGSAGRWPLVVSADNGVTVTRAALVLDIAAAPVLERPAPPVSAQPAGGTSGPSDGDAGAAGDRADGSTDPATDGAGGAGGAGGAEGADGDGADDTAGGSSDDDTGAAPPVLDPEETVSTETIPRPWWWVLGAALVGAVLLGLRTLERKLRSL